MSAETEQPHSKEFAILMALLISVVAISIDALLPALGTIAKDLQLANPNHAQYMIVALFGGMAVGQLISGPLSDALGRKKVLYWGIGLYLCGSLLCFLAPQFGLLLMGRVIEGLGVSAPYVSAVSVVRDKYEGRAMARIMSIVMMIFIMVPAVAPSIGQGILLVASWRAIFVLYLFYSVAVTSWIYFRLEETLPPEKRIPFHVPNIRNGFAEVFRNRPTMCYMACMGISFGSLIGYLNSSQQIFQVQFGVGKLFALYFGGLALVLGVASLLNSRFVERLGMHYICERAFAYIVASSLVFFGVNLAVEVQIWMFVIYAAGLFFCFGLVFGNLNALAMEPMGHIAGIASAIIGSVSSIMSMTLGAVIGQLYNGTLIPMTLGFLVLGAAALVILLYTERPDMKVGVPANAD